MIPDVIKELEDKGIIVEDTGENKKSIKEQKKEKAAKKEPKKKEEEEKKESDGEEEIMLEVKGKAKVIFVEGYDNPLMAVKSDGGYGYDSTDLAAVRHRLLNLKADRLIYITDSGQLPHFLMIFEAAKRAGWLTNQKVEHMGFGVVQGADGKKFSARKGESVKLMDLLNEAHAKALEQLKGREKEAGEKEKEK
jgi:arginyl-tRNA synthetase